MREFRLTDRLASTESQSFEITLVLNTDNIGLPVCCIVEASLSLALSCSLCLGGRFRIIQLLLLLLEEKQSADDERAAS